VLIGSLLPDKAKQEPCWTAWLMHSRYLSILTQHIVSRADLITLGALIEEHQRAFAQVSRLIPHSHTHAHIHSHTRAHTRARMCTLFSRGRYLSGASIT
jgi:hypothetical protein